MPVEVIAILVVSLTTLVFVGIPPLIALVRRHPERQLIYKLSPLTLVSFILWGALIVWAASDRQDDAIISKYVARLRESGRFKWVIVLLVVVGVAGGLFAVLR